MITSAISQGNSMVYQPTISNQAEQNVSKESKKTSAKPSEPIMLRSRRMGGYGYFSIWPLVRAAEGFAIGGVAGTIGGAIIGSNFGGLGAGVGALCGLAGGGVVGAAIGLVYGLSEG